jgi:hypothetical protein
LAFSHLKWTKFFLQRTSLVLAQARWLTKRVHHIHANGIYLAAGVSEPVRLSPWTNHLGNK